MKMANLSFCKVIFLSLLLVSCHGQNTSAVKNNSGKLEVGGGCEGCELMYIGIPDTISSESITDGWTEGKQPLMITGKVFLRDGRTPAPNVIIYYWHTNDKGLYGAKPSTPKAAITHGHLRGWVKSDKEGNYTIKTSRPANYPDEAMAAHIHLSIKEPHISVPYYADLYFDDDPKYLPHKKKYGAANRAGTELLRVLWHNNMQVAEHNIILGLNIPAYPE
jgi:protocatechuate 3,4-dioxygenase, beta subunit